MHSYSNSLTHPGMVVPVAHVDLSNQEDKDSVLARVTVSPSIVSDLVGLKKKNASLKTQLNNIMGFAFQMAEVKAENNKLKQIIALLKPCYDLPQAIKQAANELEIQNLNESIALEKKNNKDLIASLFEQQKEKESLKQQLNKFENQLELSQKKVENLNGLTQNLKGLTQSQYTIIQDQNLILKAQAQKIKVLEEKRAKNSLLPDTRPPSVEASLMSDNTKERGRFILNSPEVKQPAKKMKSNLRLAIPTPPDSPLEMPTPDMPSIIYSPSFFSQSNVNTSRALPTGTEHSPAPRSDGASSTERLPFSPINFLGV